MMPFGINPPAWMSEGACVNVGVDMFFPERGQDDIARLARRVCINCPVVKDCLDYALDRGENFGVWGGMTPRERRRVLRERAA